MLGEHPGVKEAGARSPSIVTARHGQDTVV
jgi:hypothetical protein